MAGSAPAPAQAQSVTVQVWLTPDLAGATAFADAVSTPGGAGYRHYLSPNAYTARFGPSAARIKAVTDWLTQQGLKQVRLSSGHDYLSATGAVTKLTVPSSLAADVLGVTGLGGSGSDAAASATPAIAAPTCAQFWGQHVQSFQPAYKGLTKGSLPICGYSAAQMRAAYGATSANTGKGVTVALTENASPTAMFTTLTDYAKANHLPAPRSDQFRKIESGSECGATPASSTRHTSADVAPSGPPVDDEAEMDSEAVYALAPDANQLMVVADGACGDEDQSLIDATLSVLLGEGARPSATIVSNSWQISLGMEPAPVMHAIDLRAAAEGVGMYFVSGDTPGLTMTGSDRYATVVGGTTLGVGAKGERVFETGWSDDSATLDGGKWDSEGVGGGGGGTSLDFGQPRYQKGVVPSSMAQVQVGGKTVDNRAVPDIAADGDPDTGMLIGFIQTGTDAEPGPYQTLPNAGTSLACPLVAALVADAEQGQGSAFGFINPLLYRLAGTPALHDVLPVSASAPQQDRAAFTPAADGSGPSLDVFGTTTPGAGQQVLAKGYDTITGLGTPNGSAFIDGLRKGSGR
ncbi:Peptidase S53 propeptide [Catenulispora acidiphila DSM 44928]|uniref:Peptidase S53 propeptide n=2 Tax=Catenulispora TaxID=414878 RepID=C7QKF0_CATAD|nr:Peptidase S53 propeptide [Catenulispora acidiphila DSM 44928]